MMFKEMIFHYTTSLSLIFTSTKSLRFGEFRIVREYLYHEALSQFEPYPCCRAIEPSFILQLEPAAEAGPIPRFHRKIMDQIHTLSESDTSGRNYLALRAQGAHSDARHRIRLVKGDRSLSIRIGVPLELVVTEEPALRLEFGCFVEFAQGRAIFLRGSRSRQERD